MAEALAQGMWQYVRSFFGSWVLVYFLHNLAGSVDDIEDVLLCRQCGHDVAKASDLRRIPSTHANRQRNDTVLGVNNVLIQLFENPHGRTFEVITSSKADIFKHDKAYGDYSWWSGFTWRMAMCPRCGFHLGWFFQPDGQNEGIKDTENTFVGLILENLLHQDYADSLLITPKSYRS